MNKTAPILTRFAPSPTGLLHLGHAYAALFAAQVAQKHGGAFLLRIEDIDVGRCRPEFEDSLYRDLAWLGLTWKMPVRRQSEHMIDYQTALDQLMGMELLYPCFCTRKEILCEIESAQGAPHLPPHGPDGPIYPGTCRKLSHDARLQRIQDGLPFALRLDMASAIRRTGPLVWTDLEKGEVIAQPSLFGDVVLARKDTPTSYHLAVTMDDHIQGVRIVTRGMDLFPATHIHRLLQALLGLDTPDYYHHALLIMEDGRRMAKRNASKTLHALRQSGCTLSDIHTLINEALKA